MNYNSLSRHGTGSLRAALALQQQDAPICRGYGSQWRPQCIPYARRSSHF